MEEPEPLPDALDYTAWVATYFADAASAPMGERHRRVGAWVQSLRPNVKPLALIEIWPRGSGKSTTAELAAAYLSTLGTRHFVLYVSGTQDQANKHVQAIATLLESLQVERKLNHFGQSRGWTAQLLRTASGFNVAAYGLDAALRGLKLDQFRPDVIIFDDIDDDEDSPETIKKKDRIIRRSILPSGSKDAAVLFIQNLIHSESIASRLLKKRAKFLLRRHPIGFEVAVHGLKTELVQVESGEHEYRITEGTASWEGQSLETCESQINEWSLDDFQREAQHEVEGTGGFFFNASAFRRVTVEEFRTLVAEGTRFRWCRAWDLAATFGGGDWTVGVLMAMTPNKVCFVVDVIRHQIDSSRVRTLMLRTAQRDSRGEIWSPDEYDKRSGEISKHGELRFLLDDRGPEHPRKIHIHLPQDPAQAGKDQASQLREMLAGFGARTEPVNGSKAVRARGWSDRVNSLNACIVQGDWNHDYTEEHRLFREDQKHEEDDQVDPSADAYNDLASRAKADERAEDAKPFVLRTR